MGGGGLQIWVVAYWCHFGGLEDCVQSLIIVFHYLMASNEWYGGGDLKGYFVVLNVIYGRRFATVFLGESQELV